MKKICCIVLAALCLLPCLAGCGKKDKYVEYRVSLSDDLTQPGTVTMQFYDYYFDMEEVSIEDVQTGEIETNYYATGTFLSDTNLANLPVLIHFNGDVLTLDGTMSPRLRPLCSCSIFPRVRHIKSALSLMDSQEYLLHQPVAHK